MQKNILLVPIVLVIIGGVVFWINSQKPKDGNIDSGDSTYNISIDPGKFVSAVTNRYFTLKTGTKFTYENQTDEGLERIEVVVTSEVKTVMGVAVTVVRDRVWLDDVLVEDTRDWYAQDKDGNVWYFGEQVDNYEDGVLKDNSGSWEAGVDGALPGIIMKADPKLGDSYRQEYFKGQAEDMADVVALDKEVSVPYGSYTNCLQTRDWSRIETTLNEYKYYCSEVGFVVLEEAVSGGGEKVRLVSAATVSE